MAGRLNAPRAWPPPRPLRFVAVVAAVLALHLAATRGLASLMAAHVRDAAMPPRIAVAYIRTLERAPPAAQPAPVAAAPVPPRRARAPREPRVVATAVEPAASAPPVAVVDPVALADTASAPESTPPEVVVAAMAPAEAASGVATTPVEPAGAAPAAAGPIAIAASAPVGAEPFAWPAATRVSYVLSGQYRGEVSGSAEVEWIRDGGRYQVRVDLVVGPSFAPILSRQATSEGRLTELGLAPDRYDESSRFMFRDRRHFAVVFWPESIVLANGQRRDRLPGVQDSASQFIQFTWLFGVRPELLKVGNTFEVPLALPRSMDRWFYDVRGEEQLWTSFGPLATFHLKPRRAVRRPNELAVEMWLAPELRYLPVRIRFEQDASTFIDMVIARKPELSG